jgi:hypothetical protein
LALAIWGDRNVIDLGRDKQLKVGVPDVRRPRARRQPESAAKPARVTSASNDWTCLQPYLNYGAGNETRTRDPDLGKVVLYQLSYSRIEQAGAEL